MISKKEAAGNENIFMDEGCNAGNFWFFTIHFICHSIWSSSTICDSITTFENLALRGESQKLEFTLELPEATSNPTSFSGLKKMLLGLVLERIFFANYNPASTTTIARRHALRSWIGSPGAQRSLKYMTPTYRTVIASYIRNTFPTNTIWHLTPSLPSTVVMIHSVFSHLVLQMVGSSKATIFQQYFFESRTLANSLIVAIEDDATAMVLAALKENLKFYRWEPYSIGECGRPMAQSICS